MTPAEKETLLKQLGFPRLSLAKAEQSFGRLELFERSRGASAYCLYSKQTGVAALMAKKTAERFRNAYKRGELESLRETPEETSDIVNTGALSEQPQEP